MTREEITYAQALVGRIDKLRTQLAEFETSETFGIYTLGKGQHDDQASLIDCDDVDGIDMRSIAKAAFEKRIDILEHDLSAFNPKSSK